MSQSGGGGLIADPKLRIRSTNSGGKRGGGVISKIDSRFTFRRKLSL